MSAPLLIILGLRDALLPSAERQRRLKAARVLRAIVVERDQARRSFMRDAHRLIPGEREWFASLRYDKPRQF